MTVAATMPATKPMPASTRVVPSAENASDRASSAVSDAGRTPLGGSLENR